MLATEAFTDADADRLFEHGGDDATLVTRDGITRLVFDREAESLEAAIASASADTRAADLSIARIEMAPQPSTPSNPPALEKTKATVPIVRGWCRRGSL